MKVEKYKWYILCNTACKKYNLQISRCKIAQMIWLIYQRIFVCLGDFYEKNSYVWHGD